MAIALVEEYRRPLLVPMTLVEAGYDVLVLDGRRPTAELAAEVLSLRSPAAEGALRSPA